MSRFLLAWHRGGAAVPAVVVRAAEGHAAREGLERPRRLVSSDVAAWHWPGTWASGAEEALPLEVAGWCGSAVLRLDDRATLDGRLRDAGVAGANDDARLAWRSFAAWGAEAPRHWIGDYAVAVVAPRRERMVVARGVTGVRSCFHASADGLELVSDDLALLVRLRSALGVADAAPDEQAVAEYLRVGQLVTPTLTFHRGITRVPAAHTLTVARDGSARHVRHWTFPTPEVRHSLREDEVIAEFHAVVGAAVADRLRGTNAGLLLSGGLDSPTLALAARRAAPQVAVRALTLSWARLVRDDEEGFARAAADAVGIAHDVREFAPDEGLRFASRFTTPEPAPDPEPLLGRTVAARLESLGPVALLGEDVDTLLHPPPLLEVLRHDGIARTIAAWKAYRRETGGGPWIGLRRSLPAAEEWRDRWHRRAPSWLRPEIARAWALPAVPPGRPHATRALAVRSLLQPTWEAGSWSDDPTMSGSDVTVLLPFMDPRVIAFLFSLPAIPWGQRKYLLRRSLRGLLPESSLARPKTPLGGYFEARVRVWRGLGAPAPLPAPVEAWVEPVAWRRTLAHARNADEVFAAWRVLELSRWLAQSAPGRP